MSLLDRLLGRPENVVAPTRQEPPTVGQGISNSLENPSTSLTDPGIWDILAPSGAQRQWSPLMNETTAMRVSAVFRCVNILAGLIAGTPLLLIEVDDDGNESVVPDHKLLPFFNVTPLPGSPITAFAWREMLAKHVLLRGNHVDIIRYDGAGRVTGFQPVDKGFRIGFVNGRRKYRCDYSFGDVQRTEIVDQDDILHFVGETTDGVYGVSRIQSGSAAMGLAATLEEQTGEIIINSANPSGVVSVGAEITEPGLKRMEAKFRNKYLGMANKGGVIFLDEGSKFQQMQLSPVDLAIIASRRYQNQDVGRFFGVPPHLYGEAADTSAWGSGIEQLTLGFRQFTVDQEFRRIEGELNLKLLAGTRFRVTYDRDSTISMDAKTRAEVMATEMQNGATTPNIELSRRRRPGVGAIGDQPLVLVTMQSLKNAVAPPKPPPAPAPAPADPNKPADPPPAPAKEPA